MTSPRDEGNLEVLPPEECWGKLGSEPVGRIAFVRSGEPTILPVNHVVDGRTILFRTTLGAKLSEDAMQQPIAFEVDGYESESRTGWSVLVRGRAEEVEPGEIATILDEQGIDPWSEEVGRDQWVRVRPDEVTGRRIPAR